MYKIVHEIIIHYYERWSSYHHENAVGIHAYERISQRDTKKYGMMVFPSPVQDSSVMLDLIPVYPAHVYERWNIWAPNTPLKA